MRIFSKLLSVQARALIASLAGGAAGGASRKRLALLIVGAAALSVFAVAYLGSFAREMVAAGLAGAIPLIAAVMSALVGVVFSFMKTAGTVFGLRDYDAIAALPIPTSTVVLARTATIFGSAIVLSLIVSAPLYVVYFGAMAEGSGAATGAMPSAAVGALAGTASATGLDAATLTCAALGVVLAPLAPVALAMLAACAVAAIAARFAHAGTATVALSIVLAVGLVVGVGAASHAAQGMDERALTAAFVDLTVSMRAAVAGIWPPALWLADAVAAGRGASFTAFAMVSLAVPALVVAVIARWYPQLNGALQARARARAFRVDELRGTGASPVHALMVKELRRIATLPAYTLNCGIGLVVMVALACGVSFIGLDTLLSSGVVDGVELNASQIDTMRAPLLAGLPWLFGFCSITALTAAPSVSLEGRSAWIMQTIPVSRRAILGSKLLANLVLGGAALGLSLAVLLIGGKVSALHAVSCVVVAAGMLTGFASLGLSLDVRRPNYSFASPNEVIKRGFPMMVGVIGGMVAAAAGAVGAFQICVHAGVAAALVFDFAVPSVIAGAGLFALWRAAG